jgi:hypothetical protein
VIKSCRVGVQRVWEAKCEQLRKEFDEICFKEGETVHDFSMCITGLANNITVLGGTITKAEIVMKTLHVALEPLEQVAISIETLLNVNDLTVEEVTGQLQNVEQWKKKSSSTVDKQGRLLLTEEEWLSRLKIRENSGKGGRSGSNKSGRKTNKSRDKEEAKLGIDGEPIHCLNCGKKGHWAKDCWSKPKKKDKTHLAQVE